MALGHRWPSRGVKEASRKKTPKKKVWKGVPGPLGPRAEKARKSVEHDYFSKMFRVFGSFSTLFQAFLTLGPRGSGNTLSDFCRSFLGRGLLTPVKGKRCRNNSSCCARLVLFLRKSVVWPLELSWSWDPSAGRPGTSSSINGSNLQEAWATWIFLKTPTGPDPRSPITPQQQKRNSKNPKIFESPQK